MILAEIVGYNESHPFYQDLEVANAERHYGFLLSIIEASLKTGRPFLSQTVLKALNFHAIACLHTHAGEYRPCQVTVGSYQPPEFFRVGALMDDFINSVNRSWETTEPLSLATFVLWRLNHIHPFINGNGRTARAACYFVICAKSGGLLPGDPILPQLLKQERRRLDDALKAADHSALGGALNLSELHALVSELLALQLGGSNPEPDPVAV